ncbi:MAG: glycoside hydrolase family 27 protein [Acidobacteriaceae bacterium]|nr:glycoside hydrolase family 27 protein [Acidobacteriaceae bacterium]
MKTVRKFSSVGLVLLVALAASPAQAQTATKPVVAATPPMGWNSWDSYGLTITEQQFRANVKVEADSLKPFGWNYAVIDEGWFFRNPQDRPHAELLQYQLDANGRYIPVPVRFPSAGTDSATAASLAGAAAATGGYKQLATIGDSSFKPLGDWVHSQGLRFGIHIVRGIPRASVERNLPIAGSSFHTQDAADTTDACSWDPTNWGVKDNAAGQAWYDSLLAQYAGWGVDLLKVDCIASNPYKIDEIRMIRKAIDKTGRPIVLSLSPGPTDLDNAAEVSGLAQMWRISNDIWDLWDNAKPFPKSLSSQFATTAAWAQYAKPGNWPDADMLPIGQLSPVPGEGKARASRLTPDEQQTMLSLWAMARSPLILGANLTQLDEPTRKLITNEDFIRIDQTSTRSGQVMHNGGMIAWTSDLANGETALALFNVGESQLVIDSSFEVFGLDDAVYHVKDVWTGKTIPKAKAVQGLTLEPHSCILWLLKK